MLRIWPLYFTGLITGFIIIPFIQSLFGIAFTESANPVLFLLFLSNFSNLLYGYPSTPPLGVLWTIGVLMQFYIVWPLLLNIFKKSRIFLFTLILITSCVFRYYNSSHLDVLYYHTFSVMSDFAIGGIIAIFAFRSTFIISVIKHMPTLQIVTLYLLGILLVVFDEYIFINPLLISVERIILSIFLAFGILEQNYSNHSLLKMKNLKIPTALSKYSYSFY